ncbi:class I SAM-dependent methyltransferase [Streptomyces sp. 549]|uniref:class I SAM-dependent methyltransferase n=1 Tax=Streptomyces sp. 549 TaxID=3049076 RepID=UPI0024C31414|nr:class I SAM-dependent methyltransferase [Streptomyces sp. 549]MDK1474583.1 class I SAM-dependent methyltransferase [Streptomyces sp. 549]
MSHSSHSADLDWDKLCAMLELEADLHRPALLEAAAWLPDEPAVGSVLDVGSGPGRMACLLAGRFPQAQVTAVDGSAELLARARAHAADTATADRLTTHRADLPDGFAELAPADLVWSSRAVHHLGDQQAAVDALARLVNPGGTLALSEGGLSTRFLPRDTGLGRPGLQTRLDLVLEESFAVMRAELPGSTAVVEDWPAMLARAGLTPSGTRSFLVDLPAPLGDEGREYVYKRLNRLAGPDGDTLDAEDRAAVARLLDRDDPQGLMRRPDVFYLTALTVHTARA